MKKLFRHWGLVNRHRYHVFINGCRCGIGFHCLFHDLSKFHPKEFWPSVKYYDGTHSPVLEERLQNDYFSLICQHHTKRNPHHWEYWTDFYKGKILALAMPWRYATEYVCDMLSASYCYDPKAFNGETVVSYFAARCDHYYLSDVTKAYVKWCLERFAKHGFKGLRKKDTKAEYQRILGIYPKVKTYEPLSPTGALPLEGNEPIIPSALQGGQS